MRRRPWGKAQGTNNGIVTLIAIAIAIATAIATAIAKWMLIVNPIPIATAAELIAMGQNNRNSLWLVLPLGRPTGPGPRPCPLFACQRAYAADGDEYRGKLGVPDR